MAEENEDTDGTDKENEEVLTSKKRKAKAWLHGAIFKDRAEEQQFFTEEHWWAGHKVTRTHDGTKQYYYCRTVKNGLRECAAKIYILRRADGSDESILFRHGEHTHPNENQQQPQLFDRAAQMVANNLKFRSISHVLREDEAVAKKPTDSQVYFLTFHLHVRIPRNRIVRFVCRLSIELKR